MFNFGLLKTIQNFLPTLPMGNSSSFPTKSIQGYNNQIYSFVLPHKQQLVTVCHNSIEIQQVEQGSKSHVETTFTTCACFNSDLNILYLGDKDSKIYLYEVSTLKMKDEVMIHKDSIEMILCIPLNLILSSSSNGELKLWNSETIQVVHDFTLKDLLPTCFTYVHSQNSIFVGYQSGFIHKFNLKTGKKELTVGSSGIKPIDNVAYLSKSNFLFFTTEPTSIIYDMKKEVEIGRSSERKVYSIFYDEEKDFLVTGYDSGDIIFWKVLMNEKNEKNLTEILTLKMHKNRIISFEYHTSMDILVSTDPSFSVIWKDFVKNCYKNTEKKVELEVHFQITKDQLEPEIIEKSLKDLKLDQNITSYDHFPKISQAIYLYDLFKISLQDITQEKSDIDQLEANKNKVLDSLKFDCENNFNYYNTKKKTLLKKYSKYITDSDEEGYKILDQEYEKELELMKKRHEKELKKLEKDYKNKKSEYKQIKMLEMEKGAKSYIHLKERFDNYMKQLDLSISNSIKNLIITYDTKLYFEELPSRYKILSKISGRVYKAIDLTKKIQVAIKVYPSGLPFVKLNHPSLVSVYDILTFDQNSFVIQELESETLLEYVNKSQNLSQKEIATFLFTILKGLEYLHTQYIIHKDLCLENVLINSEGEAKLIHFGLMKKNNIMVEFSENGLVYSAPELFLEKVTPLCDIWSCGLIFAYLLQTKSERIQYQLFSGRSISQVLKSISEVSSPSLVDIEEYLKLINTEKEIKDLFISVSEKKITPLNVKISQAPNEALDLLKRMLEFLPTKRITLRECLNHVYFKKYL